MKEGRQKEKKAGDKHTKEGRNKDKKAAYEERDVCSKTELQDLTEKTETAQKKTKNNPSSPASQPAISTKNTS